MKILSQYEKLRHFGLETEGLVVSFDTFLMNLRMIIIILCVMIISVIRIQSTELKTSKRNTTEKKKNEFHLET